MNGFFGGPAWLRKYDDKMHSFPRIGGQGSVTPILNLPSDPDIAMEGIVADFDLAQSPEPFKITLFAVDPKHKGVFTDVARLLELEPDEVKQNIE